MTLKRTALLSLAALFAIAAGTPMSDHDPAPGSILGRVRVELPLSPPRVRPSVRELGSDTERGRPDRSRSVVYLATAPRGAFEGPSRRRAVLDQHRETFVPYALPILAGTTVDFPNRDPFYHNVFSLSKLRRFDLGRYPQGETKSVTFDQPGIVRVFCEIHSHMSAFILVFSHRYFTTTDDEGRYRLDDVPPGDYDVVVWTDGQDRERRRVTVRPGEAAELDFVVK